MGDSNHYAFVTRWRVPAEVREVVEVLQDPLDLPRWWPSVWLQARELEPGEPGGQGRVIELYTKGWLPYTLRWKFRVVEPPRPDGFSIQAFGDFDGRGIWTFRQDGDLVDVTYDWQIRADKPLLRYLSWLLKPAFAANHRWAMARGEESLRLELQRRRAATREARRLVPAPPGPTTTSPVPLLAVTILTGALLGSLVFLALRYRLVTPRLRAPGLVRWR